ncbi:MAG TPA: precorrin-6A/cobalt-precorrin-6A reductase, partial [Candidatus Avalokitesvara rifleensis]|uniref:precorrin-6A/cobalt-precorrin-6A reductase n=1 Tax=Candidatus Avalokitesvara rifleensis TaxID=3367620 RepID=UPI0040291DBD
MILVMSGTADGREIVRELHERGAKVLTTVATTYGEGPFREMGLGHLCVRSRLSGDGLPNFIDENGIDTIVDATHPYAVNASLIAM